MAGEPEVIAPPTVVDPPSSEEFAPEVEQPVNLNDLADEPEQDDAEPAEELEEFEFNGKQIKGPKGLKDGVLMQADYTRKTQEVAATRKELEAREAWVKEQSNLVEQDTEVRAEHWAKRVQLSQYENVDWQAWVQQDPIAAQQGYIQFQGLQNEVKGLGDYIQERTQQRSAEAQQDLAKRIHETREYAKKEIKGYTAETERQVAEFAAEQGIPDAVLQTNWSPQVFKILHLARLGSQVLNKPAVPKLNQPQATPLTVVSSKGSPSVRKSIADMSMDEYAAYRTRQEAAKRGARG